MIEPFRRTRAVFRKVVWQINSVRRRDPLTPRLFLLLVGGIRRTSWDPVRTPRRVLVLRSDEIGDTVTTLTLLSAMRREWPRARVELVVKPVPATVFHSATLIDRVIPWTPVTEGSALKRQVLTVRQAWRRFAFRRYDLAVLPRWDFDDTPLRFLAAASRARSIVGFAPVPEREPAWFGPQEPLLTDVIPRGDKPLLTVDQLQRVAEVLGLGSVDRDVNPPLGTALFDDADFRSTVGHAPFPSETDLVIGVGIGARDLKRQWPVERLHSALRALSEGRSLAVLVLGGSGDRARSAELASLLHEGGVRAFDLAGKLTLSESAAAISRCGLFIGNDSGLQHIASSLDIPTVVVTCHPASGSPWSDNAPERFGPWSSLSAVVQPMVPAAGCHDECTSVEAHCIRSVSADDVITVAGRLLRERSA